MGSKLDVYKAFVEAAWANPPSSLIEANETYPSDDFRNLNKDGNVVQNKEAYIGTAQLLISAFKDFKAVYSDFHEEGDSVIVSYHFEGLNTSELDLSAMGLGIIPASGKRSCGRRIPLHLRSEAIRSSALNLTAIPVDWKVSLSR